MKKTYNLLVITILMLSFILITNNAKGVGMNVKVIPEEFEVETRVLSVNEIAGLYSKVDEEQGNVLLEKQVYVFGKVLSNSDRMAVIEINLKCKQAPYLEKKNLKIGWIVRKKQAPAYFLVNLGESLHGEDIGKLEIDYKIIKVFKK